MKKKSKIKEYLKKEAKRLKESFTSFGRPHVFSMLYDIAMLGVILFSAWFGGKFFTERGNEVMTSEIQLALVTQSTEVIQENMAALKSFYYEVLAVVIILAVLAFASYIITRMLIWSEISGKNLSIKFVKKFLLFFIPWSTAWIMFLMLVFSSVREESALVWLIVLFAAYFHITTVALTHLIKSMNARESAEKAFSTGLGKIHMFVFSYATALIVFIAANLMLALIGFFAEGSAFNFAMTIILLLYVAWLRLYISGTAGDAS